MIFTEEVIQYKSYDVVVAGGGVAGFGATVAAARKGLKVLLIESNGCIGGTSTAGNLPFPLGYTTGSISFPEMLKIGRAYKDCPHPRKAVGGIYDKFMTEVKAQNGGVGPMVIAQTDKYPGLDRLGCHDEFTYDLEIGKRVYDKMVLNAGADILYYTQALNAEIKDNRVVGIYASNKSGILFIPCKTIIDCTGDADIAYRAGYETYKGDRETGAMTSIGFVTHIENIDASKIEKYLNDGGDPWFIPACTAAKASYDGELNPNSLPKNLIIFPMVQDGVFMVNGGCNHSGDGTNGDDMSRIAYEGRKRAQYLVEHLFRKYIPGAENCKLRSTAVYPGVRETRRIVAEYVLTEQDLLEGNTFKDTIALAGRHFDLHRGNIVSYARLGIGLKNGVASIPYRSLIPQGSQDIIVAGRCIAADGQALGPARIQSTCMAVGEAAGTAAYFKVKNNVGYMGVDTDELRSDLKQNGAEVDA